MVAGKKFTLNLEHVLRVAHVTHQVTADSAQGFDTTRVDLHPRREDRVFLIPLVEVNGPVVCVNDGLH